MEYADLYKDADDYTTEELIEAIKRLEVTKNNLEKKVIDEKSKHLTLLESAYLSILSINEEQANTHFQSLDDDVPFATKVENSTNSMITEIRKLEEALDVSNEIDDGDIMRLFDDWSKLENEMDSLIGYDEPIYESDAYKEAISIVKRELVEDPITRANAVVIDPSPPQDIVQFELTFGETMEKGESELKKSLSTLNEIVEARKVDTLTMLDDLAQAAKNKMIEEKRKRAELADKKYEKVLEQFLDKAKEASDRVKASYEKENRKLAIAKVSKRGTKHRKLLDSMDEYDDESYTRKAGVPWKTEISDRFSLAFEKDIMIKKHNRSLDDELFGRMQNYELNIGSNEQIGVPNEVIEDIVDQLSDAYIESNEITLKGLNRKATPAVMAEPTLYEMPTPPPIYRD